MLDADEAMDFVTEDIADQLRIPVNDLIRWEEIQQNATQ